MKFTYEAYKALLALLKKGGYAFRNYHNYGDTSRCVILRHDIDFSLESAVRLAEVERESGVSSTYFVLFARIFITRPPEEEQQPFGAFSPWVMK